jgi:membrane-associated phospholipid phosphatase
MTPFELPSATGPARDWPAEGAWRRVNRAMIWRWPVRFAAATALIVFCIAFVDQPVARFMHEHRNLAYHIHRLSLIPVVILAGASAGVVSIGMVRALRGAVAPLWRSVLFASLACCVAVTLKTEAKYLFGRIAPGDWYWYQTLPFAAFNPLHREGSFPSGHMTAMWSIAPFLWVRYRWLRGPWIVASLAVGFALMVGEAHFVADLIGGCLLGATVGYLFLLAAEHKHRVGDTRRVG